MLSTTQTTKYHKFSQSALDENLCYICRNTKTNHKCEVCGKSSTDDSSEKELEVTLMYGKILFCKECHAKEIALTTEAAKPENVAARVEAVNAPAVAVNKAIEQSRAIDNSVQIRSDLFNAATESIINLKAAIDADSNITNKPYALAEELTKRFTHFKNVIFEANETVIRATNDQKAIQVYLNNLANQLRAEEREKLKLQDINYQPKSIKPVKPAAIKTAKKKLDKAELRKYAAELGIPEFTLQMLVVSKGVTVEQAAGMLRKSINEAKSEVK